MTPPRLLQIGIHLINPDAVAFATPLIYRDGARPEPIVTSTLFVHFIGGGTLTLDAAEAGAFRRAMGLGLTRKQKAKA